MIYKGLNRTGKIETVKAHGGYDVAEVYGGINESNPIYYKTRTLTGTLPLSYKALGNPLSDYLISGNTIQDGMPTPEAPVDVVGCGAWDETQQNYKLPLTVNGTEYPIYLGQVPTTRHIKKLVLTGEETFSKTQITGGYRASLSLSANEHVNTNDRSRSVCSHFTYRSDWSAIPGFVPSERGREIYFMSTYSDFASYCAQQYAAGTPVTVLYVLAEPETGIINEPLMKIGDYADTISMAQAGVTIQTIAGANTLTIDTTVQPSAVSITGNIKEVSG